jgi:hypothetical protein
MHTNIAPGQREGQDLARMAESLTANGYTVTKPDSDTVTIPRAEYDSLKNDEETLCRLNNAGVDNWEWYSEAIHHPESYE